VNSEAGGSLAGFRIPISLFSGLNGVGKEKKKKNALVQGCMTMLALSLFGIAGCIYLLESSLKDRRPAHSVHATSPIIEEPQPQVVNVNQTKEISDAQMQPKEISPEERLVENIRKSLTASNRGRERISVAIVEDFVKVQFSINDNLTESMIKIGAQRDIVDLLKAAIDSGSDFREIRIVGTFPLVDVYGNSQESRILDVVYSSDNLKRVNWKNFQRENIYKIADKQSKVP